MKQLGRQQAVAAEIEVVIERQFPPDIAKATRLDAVFLDGSIRGIKGMGTQDESSISGAWDYVTRTAPALTTCKIPLAYEAINGGKTQSEDALYRINVRVRDRSNEERVDPVAIWGAPLVSDTAHGLLVYVHGPHQSIGSN